MTAPRLVGLVGRAGAGKDTVGSMLERLHDWRTLSFSSPLKQICRDVFDFSDLQLYGPSEARNGPDKRYPRLDGTFLTPREALQQLGTEWGRRCYPNVWADLGVRRASVHRAAGHSIAFTDCRFVNEAEAIRSAGGEIWRIYRPSADMVRSDHISETEMDGREMRRLQTHTVTNAGTIAQLQAAVAACVAAPIG